MDSLFGLPAHPLIVHAAVVLLPLAAAGVIAVAVAPKLRSRYTGLVVLLAAAAAGIMPLASESGESLMRAVEFSAATTEHVNIGETGTSAGIAVLIAALAVWGVQHRARSGRRPKRWLVRSVAVVAVVASVAATVQIVRIGHTGATSVWENTVIPPEYED